MLWKLLGLQKILDSLFEDGWICLGLPEETSYDQIVAFELLQS